MKKLALSFFAAAVLSACGGGGGDAADRAVKAADGACKCTEYECTRQYIQELNKIAIKDEAAVKELSAERHKVYKDAQSRGADCQDKLRP
jgi:hypothetical protein